MSRDIADYLQDILDNIEIATDFLDGSSLEDLENDRRTTYAVVRAIEIVGEAAKSIPTDIRQQYPEIPWRIPVRLRQGISFTNTSESSFASSGTR
ncbi:MAG: DUF86 domain-containing protein [Geitlerinemataceae cyanobacterium]